MLDPRLGKHSLSMLRGQSQQSSRGFQDRVRPRAKSVDVHSGMGGGGLWAVFAQRDVISVSLRIVRSADAVRHGEFNWSGTSRRL